MYELFFNSALEKIKPYLTVNLMAIRQKQHFISVVLLIINW